MNRNSYASEDSDSDGTPPPSILVALARVGKTFSKDKGADKGKGKAKGLYELPSALRHVLKHLFLYIVRKRLNKPEHHADIIELSDSDSSIKHRPKKRAKMSAQEKTNDVIDLCSDEDERPRRVGGSSSSRENAVLVLTSDDEQVTAPPEPSPTPFSSPERGKKTKSIQPRPLSPLLPSHPPRPFKAALSLFSEEHRSEQAPSSIASFQASPRPGKRKRLTQQDYITAFESKRNTTSFTFSSPFLSSRSNYGMCAQQRTYNIKYSNDSVSPPLLTQALFSSTVATMKVRPIQTHEDALQIKSSSINLGGAPPDTELRPTDNQAPSSGTVETLTIIQTEAEDAQSTDSGSRPLMGSEMMNVDSQVEGSTSDVCPRLPLPASSSLPKKHPPDMVTLPAPEQEAFVESRVASVKLCSQGSQLRRSLSVLHIDAARLTASAILASPMDRASDDELSLSDLELGYPEPES